MDDSKLDPDPRRRVPTVLWLMLGLLGVVGFAALVFLVLGHGQPHLFGPPPGAP